MAKKNYTWKLEEDLVSKIQKLAELEHRSLTNYIEVVFIREATKLLPQAAEKGREKIETKKMIPENVQSKHFTPIGYNVSSICVRVGNQRKKIV